jgi:hypothetical protein
MIIRYEGGHGGRTFGEKTGIVVDEVTTQKPSVAKLIISFY